MMNHTHSQTEELSVKDNIPENDSRDTQKKFGFWRILFNRNLLLFLADFACFAVLTVALVLFQLVFNQEDTALHVNYLYNAALFFVCVFGMRMLFRAYKNVWRYANARSFLHMILCDLGGGILALIIANFSSAFIIKDPVDYMMITATFSLCTLSMRLVYQLLVKLWIFHRHDHAANTKNKIGVAIVGAGQTGTALADELMANDKSHYNPICFIDKDETLVGKTIYGRKVYPACQETVAMLKDLPVQEVFIALPSLDSASIRELHDVYSTTGCKVKLYDFPMKNDWEVDTGTRRNIRDIRVEDLLFRDTLKINNDFVHQFYTGKTILVTGGGGSIGSELCRQIAKRHPKRLIILDIYENNAYDIQQELIRKYGDSLDLITVIASVRDRVRLEAIFAAYRPDIVFHAAAHKHVPLMEHSGCEAIKNNVLGTYNTADMAEKYGVERFILVSTDKAVNPTNIMGASKRMCEMVVQCRTDSNTSFAAVRFGNVLGSNGSVIPLFKRQIEMGGPITLTDKRIIRYFMTIPEASQLVMQAGAMAKRGELFVLDMGKPVRIVDLAENMIKLSGYRPYVDIDIVEVGLRPGEKLYEELLMKSEQLTATDDKMIFIEHDTPLTRAQVEAKLDLLRRAVERSANTVDSTLVRRAMMQAVPTFHSPEQVNRDAEASSEMKMVEELPKEENDGQKEDIATSAVPVGVPQE